MSASKIKPGDRFSKLVVLERDFERKSKHSYYKCQCDCGAIISVAGSNLLSGNSTKCASCSYTARKKNLIGQTFERLTVVSENKTKKSLFEYSRSFWNCQCICGNSCVVDTYSLTSGHTKSCGCLQKEIVAASAFQNLVGQVFGKLTVTEFAGRKADLAYWYCDCSCGTKHKKILGRSLTLGKTVSCGCVKSKGEFKISQLLASHNINYKTQFMPEDFTFSATGKHCYFDFAVYTKNWNLAYFIEYQGEQHFNSRKNGIFTEEEVNKIKKRDQEKLQYCINRGITLIYIPYSQYETFTADDIIIKELLEENINNENK